MSTMYLVSCVARKRDESVAAKDLYVSDWFVKARAYVERVGADCWFILSARYGLVDPEAVIAPYEQTLNAMGVAARRAWAARVLDQLRPKLNGVDRVVMLAGLRYREFLIDDIRARCPSVEVPLAGRRIGEQLGWFKRELQR